MIIGRFVNFFTFKLFRALFILYIAANISFVMAASSGINSVFSTYSEGNSKNEVLSPSVVQSGPQIAKEKITRQEAPEVQEKLAKSIVYSSKDWTVLSANPNGKKMCYSVLYAKNRIGNLPDGLENKAYLMIHYFSAYKQRVSVFFDYKLKKGSRVFLSVDGKPFEMQPFDQFAFSDDAETDTSIISAILSGKRLLARGEGDENAYSVDEYDISGFASVYTKMKQECGI